jgi:hypothetical protein
MRTLFLGLFLILALTSIPYGSAATQRNFLKESGMLQPGYTYTLLYSSTLNNLTNGVVKVGQFSIIYHKQYCYTNIGGTFCNMNDPAINFTVYPAPSCTFQNTSTNGVTYDPAPVCNGFIIALETEPFGANNQPIPGVSCCDGAIITAERNNFLASPSDLMIYLYLATG